MGQDKVSVSGWQRLTNICGWLSLFCWLPLLMLVLGSGRIKFSDWVFRMLLYGIYLGPIAGAVLAVIAATGRRWWWIVLAAVSAAAVVYGWWDLSHHPIDL